MSSISRHFYLWTIPGKRAPGDHFDLILAQAGTGAVLPLSLVKKDAGWFIVYPSADVLTNARKALLARSNGRLPPPGGYKRRTSARDAVRSFLEAFNDWGGAGHDQALDALDLSDFSEAVRVYEGELAAQYLKEVIDRIGDVVPQEIPDDPTSFEPYTLFSHPAGRIVVAATGAGDKPSWKFDSTRCEPRVTSSSRWRTCRRWRARARRPPSRGTFVCGAGFAISVRRFCGRLVLSKLGRPRGGCWFWPSRSGSPSR